MYILMRLDYSATIGMGHLVRCMALAHVLKEAGAHILFVCHHPTNQRSLLFTKSGFDVESIGLNPLEMKNNWQLDAEQTINFIENRKIKLDWIIVDHYKIDIEWESCMRSYARKIMVIDDLANRHHDCDVLLDQNAYPNATERYLGKVQQTTSLMLGPAFALLRQNFLLHRNKLKKKKMAELPRILIFFGGGDCAIETLKALNACLSLNRKIYIDVVVSQFCSKKMEIKATCDNFSFIHYFCDVSNIAELMILADLAIGAGGSTHWERCCLGLPSVILTIASNQVTVTQHLETLGVLYYLGSAEEISEVQLANCIDAILNEPKKLAVMREKALGLVDGRGCNKIASHLLGTAVYA